MNPTRSSLAMCVIALAALAFSGCASAASTPATDSATVTVSDAATPSAGVSTSAASPAVAADCIPSDVTAAGIPIVSGTVVCDLVRGELSDGTLSIVVQVASVDEGFSAATSALSAAGYTAGVTSPEASDFTNGTYTVLVSVTEQDPYGAVVTYALSPA